jgi:hypothetical protein
MKCNDASWHYEGESPEDLSSETGATHVGMFARQFVSVRRVKGEPFRHGEFLISLEFSRHNRGEVVPLSLHRDSRCDRKHTRASFADSTRV